MTEDEAKTKWCPFVRRMGISSGQPEQETVFYAGVNRAEINNLYFKGAECIGSACMAWRWALTPEEIAGGFRNYLEHVDEEEPLGYCGLAGKP